MRGEGALDLPPEALQINEGPLIPILQHDLVAVLGQQVRHLLAERTDTDGLDLQQRVIIGALIDVAIGVAGKLVLIAPEHDLHVDRLRRSTDGALLRAGGLPAVAMHAAPLPPEPPHGVDPAIPLPLDLMPLLPDGFDLEPGCCLLEALDAGQPVEGRPLAEVLVAHLRGVQDAHVPVLVLCPPQQMTLDVAQ